MIPLFKFVQSSDPKSSREPERAGRGDAPTRLETVAVPEPLLASEHLDPTAADSYDHILLVKHELDIAVFARFFHLSLQ